MKKVMMFMVLICIATGMQAQLLWKITGNGLESPSYVFGTYHLAPLSIKDSVPQLPEVMAETKQVYGEILMEEMMKPENLMKIQQQMVLPGDTTLSSFYSQEEYRVVSEGILQNMGVDVKMVEKLKPAALSTQLAVIMAMKVVKGFNPQEQLDTWFQMEAKKAGKIVGSLETIEEQTYILYGSQSLQRQADLLYCALTNIDFYKTQSKEMYDTYMAQNLDGLFDLMEMKMNSSCDSRPEEMETLIYDRNAKWAKLLPTVMGQAPTLLVVGGGHLPGQHGLLNLLRQAGYTVEPVR